MGLRMRRIVIGALLLLLALAVGAVLFARSTRALQWAASQLSAAVEQAGGRLAFTELSGSLFTAIGAARIDYEQADGTRATLTGVQIDPSLAALWHRQLVFDRIAIATAGIERPASDEPAVEPRSLALPIEVRVDRATVDRLSWRSGTTAIELARLDFAYRGGPDRHEVDALSVRLPGLAGPAEADTVVLNLTGRIDARAPFALAVKLGVSADALGRAEAVLGGRLAEVSVEGTLAGNAARDWLKARVAATIAPFSTTMLASLRLAAEGVDAAVVSKGAPTCPITCRRRSCSHSSSCLARAHSASSPSLFSTASPTPPSPVEAAAAAEEEEKEEEEEEEEEEEDADEEEEDDDEEEESGFGKRTWWEKGKPSWPRRLEPMPKTSPSCDSTSV